MADFANAYAAIIKADKNDDGTLTVYGKATDDSIDMDQQICDPTWLDTAMPEWFKSGGNIREQHSNIAAGVAKEYEAKNDGHYISALVVDPVSVKKVETGVLRGFSIGIKSPRVVRDQKAANGRIIDGQIIEVSLVDRPANPNAKLIMAKSVEGESSLVQVEELHEYKAPLPTAVFKTQEGENPMSDEVELAAKADELNDTTEGCDCEGCKMCKTDGGCDDKMCKGHHKAAKKSEDEENDDEADMEKSVNKCLECGCHKPADSHGADKVEIPSGSNPNPMVPPANVSTADIVDYTKSVEADDKNSAAEEVAESNIADVVEKAVRSAMESVKSEIDSLRAEKESAVEKSVKLESELATALSKTVAGGPKRTATVSGAQSNEYLVKAATYKAKADATTDPVLAKGYIALYEEFSAKAGKPVENE